MSREDEVQVNNSVLENDSATLTIQEVVAATLAAMNMNRRTEASTVSAKELSNLLPEFDGDNVTAWLQRIDIIKNTYQPSENVLLLVAVGKLKGRVLDWYHSKPEHAAMNLANLAEALKNMFEIQEDLISLMRKFEARKWQKGEKFNNYFTSKVNLANRLSLPEKDIITYVIEGLDNEQLQMQCRMKEFTSLNHLLSLLNEITTWKQFPSSVRRHPTSYTPAMNAANGVTRDPTTGTRGNAVSSVPATRCFNCNGLGHMATSCPKPQRPRGSCYECGSQDHQFRNCTRRPSRAAPSPDSTTHLVEDSSHILAPFQSLVSLKLLDKYSLDVLAIIDTGSPISIISERVIDNRFVEPYNPCQNYEGVNKSKLEILGVVNCEINIANIRGKIKFHVVPPNTISNDCLLGRNLLELNLELTFTQNCVQITPLETEDKTENLCSEILNITVDEPNAQTVEFDVNQQIEWRDVCKFNNLFKQNYVDPIRPPEPMTEIFLNIQLIPGHKTFFFRPRRLPYTDREKVHNIVQDLLDRNIIRRSNSEYASPIVLVTKKNKDVRMCVDFRTLNGLTLRDNFPIPHIQDQLDQLNGMKFFSKLDLKDAFYHVKVAESSIKYTSFVTDEGQFEYLRMPFGLKNSPALFTRFINTAFRELLDSKRVLIYIDDLLIATHTFDEHLDRLTQIFKILVQNRLELRIQKCKFLQSKINYLGYDIDKEGIRPSYEHTMAVRNYAIPTSTKEVHSFIGLVSYFRRFIKNFSTVAAPLYSLLRKNAEFKFGEGELHSFSTLKNLLVSTPVLKIYNPKCETQLHCDASSHGFGAILMQRQSDKHFYPIAYYSRRTTEAEAKMHSFELETLAIVYALQRFDIYLKGIEFKIFTDCNSLKQTLEKKDICPKILRWSFVLQNYSYKMEHRIGEKMKHVDALSRVQHLLVIDDNSMARNMLISQTQDPIIKEIACRLLEGEDKMFELRDGVVYRKAGKRLLFYAPEAMICHILNTYHDKVGHCGIEKTVDLILNLYWFPNLRNIVKQYVQNCLKCISYSPVSGKREGYLHVIPKGNLPFQTIHIDHYGPLEATRYKKKYIFEVVDGFTKFVRFYPCTSTTTKEVLKHLESYFENYSTPSRIISDRATCFSSDEFKKFVDGWNIKHVLVATGAPQANGQIERINRTLTPMMSKLTSALNKWDEILGEVEFALNNTKNKSTGETPSMLLYGVKQRRKLDDNLAEFLENKDNPQRNLLEIRKRAEETIEKSQEDNKRNSDKKRKKASEYCIGDFVMVKNVDVTPGVNKKLLPKYRGPYRVKSVLENDRYVIEDIEGLQVTQLPFTGVFDVSRMKKWQSPLPIYPIPGNV